MFLDVNGFGVTLGSLYIEAQGYVSVLLENLCGMSCPGTCWPMGGVSVFCRLVVPLYYEGSSLWVGLDGWLVKVSG